MRILSNEKEVEKLSRDDVTFLKHELFGPVLGSTAGRRRAGRGPDGYHGGPSGHAIGLFWAVWNLHAIEQIQLQGRRRISTQVRAWAKSRPSQDVSRETRLESVDHDRTLRNAMAACPELLPSYRALGAASCRIGCDGSSARIST